MQIFDVIIFFELRTIQQKTVKPTYLTLNQRLIKKRSFNLLCVLDLFFRTLAVNSVSDFPYSWQENDLCKLLGTA